MSIRPIIFAPGEYYHIYSRGVDKREIFLDQADYRRFVRLLYASNSSVPVHLSKNQGKALTEMVRGEPLVYIGAWCLMTNHFHLLIKGKDDDGITNFLQRLLTGYSMYFNKRYERKGALFSGKFQAKHLDTDNYLKYQYSYIHLNPVGIVDSGWKNKKIKDKTKAKDFLKTYPYSSYLDYLGQERELSAILDRKEFPDYFDTTTKVEGMIDDWLNFSADE